MKRCPLCKTVFPDDANFCPMDAGRLVEATGMSMPMPAAATDQPTMASRLLGGRFQVGAELGGHRTGQVFAAEDAVTGVPCVVKMIAGRVFPTPMVQQRTERELKQLMKVHSDKVTKILEVGKQANRLWIACEQVTGVPLAEIIHANGPMDARQAVRVALDVGEALAEAAKLGVIHRDVSPKNVLLDGDRVKVLNFGIPTPIGEKLWGVPEYMSPEQAQGQNVDQRSNIYSLGALLYFMLTGEPPFSGDLTTVLRAHTFAPAPRPSDRVPGVSVPPDVERVVLKALEKQSSKRHLTLRQLLSELEASIGMPPRPVTISSPPPLGAPASSPQVAVPQPVAVHSAPPIVMAPPPEEVPAGETLLGVGGVATVPLRKGLRPQAIEVVEPAPDAVTAPVTKPQAVIIEDPALLRPKIAEQVVEQVVEQVAEKVVEIEAEPPPAVKVPVPVPVPAEPERRAAPEAQPQPKARPKTEPDAAQPGAKKRKPTQRTGALGKKKKFRETLWFKKGELDAQAAADAASPKASVSQPLPDQADLLPIEDRYKDDGSLTVEDRERLSLRTGSTQSTPAVRDDQIVPGRRMDERELAGELAGRRLVVVAIVLIVLLAAAAAAYYFLVYSR